MVFRPLPVLTIFMLPILGALVALGLWQAQRAGWKAELIARYEQSAARPAEPLESVLCGDGEPPVGSFVSGDSVAARLPDEEPAASVLRMFGHAESGAAGWRLFQPIGAPDCVAASGAILVETGLEPLQTGATPAPAAETSPPPRYSLAPWPERSWFAPENAPQTNDWHWFDAPAMAAALGVDQLETRYYLSPSRGLPDFLARTPPSRHVGYSVTWFGMAVALIVMYAAYHARVGRLSFGGKGA